VIKNLVKYFLDNSKADTGFRERLDTILNGEGNGDVALVLSERIINMPAAVAAPSYKMLLEEIQWANEDVMPFTMSILTFAERTLRVQSFLNHLKNVCPERFRR
jgi:protein BCP1